MPSFKQATEGPVPAVEIVDLCKSFGSFQAVDHLSFGINNVFILCGYAVGLVLLAAIVLRRSTVAN